MTHKDETGGGFQMASHNENTHTLKVPANKVIKFSCPANSRIFAVGRGYVSVGYELQAPTRGDVGFEIESSDL